MPDILVVEDDENLNRGITFSLKKSGYEVFSAESVKKAKRIAIDHNVDVTICDVNLPDGNGLEFVRWMRCNYNTYIICLTALDQEMDQVMGYEGMTRTPRGRSRKRPSRSTGRSSQSCPNLKKVIGSA